MCKAMDVFGASREAKGRAKGRAEGRAEGISKLISLCREMKMKKTEILEKLCKLYDLSAKEATGYLAR